MMKGERGGIEDPSLAFSCNHTHTHKEKSLLVISNLAPSWLRASLITLLIKTTTKTKRICCNYFKYVKLNSMLAVFFSVFVVIIKRDIDDFVGKL